MKILLEQQGYAIIRLGVKYHVVGIDRTEEINYGADVYSVVPGDYPSGGKRKIAELTDIGVWQVSDGRSLDSAITHFLRLGIKAIERDWQLIKSSRRWMEAKVNSIKRQSVDRS